MTQRVGRGLALLFYDGSTRRGSVVSSTLRPHFSHGKDPVPIVQEAGWAPGPVWTGGISRPTGIRSPDRPTLSHLLYQLSNPAHYLVCSCTHINIQYASVQSKISSPYVVCCCVLLRKRVVYFLLPFISVGIRILYEPKEIKIANKSMVNVCGCIFQPTERSVSKYVPPDPAAIHTQNFIFMVLCIVTLY